MANEISFQSRHIKEEAPGADELKSWHSLSGLKYKELRLKDKLPNMSEEEQITLLASDGMLVKQPILVGDGFVLVGFWEAEWTAALGKIRG